MRKVILLGFGTVGRCLLPLLLSGRVIAPDRIVVIDKNAEQDEFDRYSSEGVRYLTREITPGNLSAVLAEAAESGDLLINLSVSIHCMDLADWCQSCGVMYIDTAFEPWGDNIFGEAQPPQERTMYWEHHSARRHAATHWRKSGPTALFGHGANPGLVSHFAKAALMELARKLCGGAEVRAPSSKAGWAGLAKSLGVQVIHISERDTQIASVPKRVDEFVNTWSVFSFIEESCRPVEIGWGSHERLRPVGALEHSVGPRNSLYIPVASSELLLRSWVPQSGPIEGLALPHSESITISDYFTLEHNDGTFYRPTVAYCYLASDAALASIHETRMNNWRLPEQHRVLAREIVDGADELGVLILGPEQTGWWYGSRLDIQQTRAIFSDTNATALQVAAGVVAASKWIFENDSLGYRESEDLPFEEILEYARPYLGTIVSTPTSWNPLQGRRSLYQEPFLDLESPWQFNNFLVHSGFRGR